MSDQRKAREPAVSGLDLSGCVNSKQGVIVYEGCDEKPLNRMSKEIVTYVMHLKG